MNKKKIARIIVSPIIFIFMVFAMIMFPISYVVSIIGIIKLIEYPFINHHEDEVLELLEYIFVFFTLPYDETKNWINKN